jgi:hypothetical protein
VFPVVGGALLIVAAADAGIFYFLGVNRPGMAGPSSCSAAQRGMAIRAVSREYVF